MKCCVHRGSHEVGGNCVEIESSGKRIVIDLGLPLSDAPAELPGVRGFRKPDANLLGIFVSHPHPDHYGMFERLPHDIPLYIGEAAFKILEVSAFFTPLPPLAHESPTWLRHEVPVELGPFRVTPYRIDHSAYDSYCFLIESDGKRVFYSGDIRGHGRRSDSFDALVADPPGDVDVLICEGTQIGRDATHDYPDERSVSTKFREVIADADGLVLVWCSSQNLDRVASIYDAALSAGRQLMIDVYTAELLRVVSDPDLPRAHHDNVRVYLPASQKRSIVRAKAFERVQSYYPRRIYPEDLAEAASQSVMLFRPSMVTELERAQCLERATVVSSVWSGYVKRSPNFLGALDRLALPLEHVHTSGHATVQELKRFAEAFSGARVVPIHLEDREGFVDLMSAAELHDDGEWWEV